MKPLALLTVLIASAAAHADDKASIKSAYDQITAGMKARDSKKVLSFVREDFTFTQSNRTFKRKDFEKELKAQFELKLDVKSITMDYKSFVPKGDKMTVSYESVLTANFSRSATTKKPSVLKVTHTAADVWQKAKGSWKLLNSKTLKETVLLDGKPFAGG